MDVSKLVVVDIETAGLTSTYGELCEQYPRLGELWKKRDAWLRERYPENKDLSTEEMWALKSGLHPEFGRVVCVTFGSIATVGSVPQFKVNSFYGNDELDILTKTNIVLKNATSSNMTLAGHTIERFDVPFLWKRMLINRIAPAGIITTYDKKPWDLKFMDVAKFWSGGAWQEGFTSLDTMSALFGIDSPKADMQANRVHVQYYNGDNEGIKKYCEGDVIATMKIIDTFSEVLNPRVASSVL